ncbi:MAG: response regulator [Planctomycetaceae bacterium]|nr:response regulator [Planctomycetaceae bacterium]
MIVALSAAFETITGWPRAEGLAISQRLARQLGGNLTVRSTPGAGTSFTLSVPLGMPLSEAFEQPEPQVNSARFLDLGSVAESIPRLQARILLAEDHDANRQVITLRLNQAGAEVVQARNGKEAIDLLRDAVGKRPIDAVIMDMEMPVLDGYEAVRQLRAGGFTGPIIAVTAYAMSKDREECLRIGCDDHVSKPIQWDRFFLKLSQLLHADNGSDQGPPTHTSVPSSFHLPAWSIISMMLIGNSHLPVARV